MPAHEPRTTTHDPRCTGFREILKQRRERRETKGGQPWLVRKLTVGIAVGIVGYTVYVYVATFCVPMIRRNFKALGGRAIGIAFLVVFSLLFLMFGWTYTKVVFTSPGYARDYVARTPPPIPGHPPPSRPGPWESDESLVGSPYDTTTQASRSHSRPSINNPSSNSQTSPHSPHPSRPPRQSRHNTHNSAVSMSQIRPVVTSHRSGESEVGPDGVPPKASSRAAAADSTRGRRDPLPPSAAHLRGPGHGPDIELPPHFYARRPPTHPVLLPEYRYCYRDGLVKPMRAHHCRSCGTCIMKYDHHCPWIGQCVGAFNHKFFVNFLQWSTVFSLFVFTTLVVLNARASALGASNINPQHIVIIALSGIFTLFTCALFTTHVHLIILNASTVEHMGMQRMREREQIVLSEMTSFPWPCSSRARDLPVLPEVGGRSFRVLTSRRRIQKQWDVEWGKIGTEGNLWWLGSKRANWEATMGRNKWGWILPIGRSLGNGLTYPANPRFDRDGRWRRRAEWPDGFR